MVRGAGNVLVVALVAIAVGPLEAQTPTAEVTGVVRDSADRPLVEARVTAVDRATGFAYRASTSSTGRFWLRGLPPGTYEISASGSGARGVSLPSVELPVGRTVSLDFALPPSVVEVAPIAVRIERPLSETTKSGISYVLDRDRITLLPEESRNFIELARLVPGATAGVEDTGGLPSFGTRGSAVGALNQQSLGVFVDGGDFTEAFFGELGASVPLLAVQEFEVLQSRYSAELGRAASGVVNVVTRRGGAEFEADAFGLYRHHALNARGPFESRKPDFNRSHWGLAAGGPLGSDRTRFFAAFERRVQNDFATVNTGGAFPEFEGTFETPLTDNLMFARVDHRASEGHELTLRYAGETGEQLLGVGGRNALENGQNNDLDMHSGLFTHRWTPGNGWLNQARLHVMHLGRDLERNAPPGPTLDYPSLRAGPNRMRGSFRNLRIELRDDVSRVISGSAGAHRLSFGARIGWQQNDTETFFFDEGFFIFPSDTSSRPGFGIVTFADGAIRLDARNVQLGFYAQDDWTLGTNLTLNLGLRYDLETNGSNQGFVSPFAGELPFIPEEPRPIDADNLAPRIGFAWDSRGDGRTVVHGGFGIFYDALFAVPLQALERSSGVRTARVLAPESTDIDRLMIDPDTLPPTVWTQGRIETPMTRQISLGFEHILPADIVVRVDGILIQGRNLLLQRELNPLVPIAPLDPRAGRAPRYPDFASVLQVLSAGRATGKMLLVEAEKTFSDGWLSVAYTLADRKNTNDRWTRPTVPQTDPNGLDLDAEWGPAAWDERHRLVATGGIEWPFGLGLVGKAVYASARPFSAVPGVDVNGDGEENDWLPGEGRNARRGPDFFRFDASLGWRGLRLGSASFGIQVNVYNLFDTSNPNPASIQNVVDTPGFGRPRSAFPGRQVELGIRARWR
ncbi:MAG: TonB-dependent receptor [Gemmatimonadota bacterium]|nr:TonB-dependent receptor [Gemmatimonadota bacterium]